jgi:hypothetical protein
MSLSTVSATVVDPSGQAFANGTWQLVFKPAPNTPGLFTDGGVSFTTIFRGSLDGAGAFSQAVARNDTIAPAGSRWTLTVAPNANGQAFSVDLNINSGAFNASAAINAVVTNIIVQALPVTHAYKDSEVIPIPGSGGLYYDVTLKVLKIWDAATGVWISLAPLSGTVLLNPLAQQTINGFPLVLEGASLGFSGAGSTVGDSWLTRTSVGNFALGTTPGGTNANLVLNSVIVQALQQVANNFFSILDGNGISRFFLSNTSPYTNTFISAISGGSIFIGSTSKCIVNNDTGNISLTGATSGTTTIAASAIASGTVSLPATTDTLAALALAQTLTNKRLTPRQVAMADAVAITPTSDTADINTFVSTQIAGTLTVNAPSGTPTDGQKLTLRLKSTNAQTYSFNATYAFSTSVTAPTTLAAGKTDYIGLMWNATNTKWDVVAVDQGH